MSYLFVKVIHEDDDHGQFLENFEAEDSLGNESVLLDSCGPGRSGGVRRSSALLGTSGSLNSCKCYEKNIKQFFKEQKFFVLRLDCRR